MKRIFSNSTFLLIAAIAAPAFASVNIESDLRVPGFAGVTARYAGPTEIGIETPFTAKVQFEAPAAAVEALLVSSGMPPIEKRESLEGGKVKDTALVQLCFQGSLSFCLRPGSGGSWRGEADLFGLTRDFANGGPQYLSPVGRYNTFFDGRSGMGFDTRGNVVENRPLTVARLKNAPSAVEVPVSEIIRHDSVVDDERDNDVFNRSRETYDRLRRFCGFPENRARSGFSEFLCARIEDEAFVQNVKLRVQFVDQDGVERDLVFERSAPLRGCDFMLSETPKCFDAGDDLAAWENWFDAASFAAARAYIDGSRTLSDRLVFESIERHLPKVADAQPILRAAQTHSRRLR